MEMPGAPVGAVARTSARAAVDFVLVMKPNRGPWVEVSISFGSDVDQTEEYVRRVYARAPYDKAAMNAAASEAMKELRKLLNAVARATTAQQN